jgi:hypothetical protein
MRGTQCPPVIWTGSKTCVFRRAPDEIAVTRSTIDCTGTRFGLKLKRLATDPDARSSVVPVAIVTGTAKKAAHRRQVLVSSVVAGLGDHAGHVGFEAWPA